MEMLPGQRFTSLIPVGAGVVLLVLLWPVLFWLLLGGIGLWMILARVLR